MAITVGSVEVDVIPNTRGIYGRLRSQLEPVARRVGRDVGDQIGQSAARQISSHIAGAVRNGVTTGGRTARADATRQGDDSGGAFGRAFQNRVRAAMASLPRADVRLSDTGFNADLARLRSRLETLSGRRIGVDVDAARALAEVDRLDADLARLGARHPDIQVRMDTGRARAELAALRTQIAAADRQDVDIDVHLDTGAALAAIFQLTVALAAVAAIPAIPVLAAGLGAVAAAGTAAAAGVGAVAAVAVPAVLDISRALQAQQAAQDAAATSTARGGQAASQAASRALQMAGAQQALAAAHRNAARQIAQAERGVQDAVRQAAEANQSAAQQVRQARQALAGTYEQAAEQMRAANERVADAERQLVTAQRDARQAQTDLTQARRDAAAELVDLGNRLASAQLSERDAVLAVQEAEARLRATQAAGSQATVLEQQRAQLAYDQALQRLAEQRIETERLTAEKAAADRAGVDGSRTVLDAQERLARAQESVADQEAELSQAREAAARQQVQNAADIADAQERVAEAQRNVARTQEDGARSVARAQEQLAAARQSAADSIASAERQIAQASLSAAGGVDAAAEAQARYQQALDGMTPATRATYNSFLGLRDAFREWSRELQPAVMPIFTRALDGLRNALPGITPFALAAAGAIGGLQDRISRGFDSEGWRTFRDDLADATGPAITGLGVAVGNIGRGLGGIIGAFLPHMDAISERMQSITGGFADWGASLRGSPEFEGFLRYAAEMGPQVAETLGAIGSAFSDTLRALEPMSGPVLDVLQGIAETVGWLAREVPGLVPALYLGFVATRAWALAIGLWTAAQLAAAAATRAWAAIQVVFNAVMAANPIVLVTLAIAALVAGVIYAYQNFDWFRTGVQAAWDGIRTAAVWTWENALKPTFEAIADIVMWLWDTIIWPYFNLIIGYYRMLGDVAMWLWRYAISPAIDGIAAVITWWWNNIVRRYFNFVWNIVRTVGDVFSWLWREAVRPVLGWIGDRISWVWNNAIKPGFDAIKNGVEAVGEAFEAAKDAIRTAWNALEDITKRPVNFVIGTVYNDGIRRVWNTVVGAFGGTRLERVQELATGGVLPGYTPGRDVHLAALSGGEAIMRPEWTRAVGPGYVEAMNAAARGGGVAGVQKALGLPGFAGGGIFEGIGDVASGAWDAIKAGAGWLRETFQDAVLAGAETIINPLIDLIPGSGRFKGLLKGGANSMLRLLIGAGERGEELSTPHVDYRSGAGVEQWRPVVLQALREVGQNRNLAGVTLRRMNQESGGNPTIVNRWDSNWERGTPSVGLMQVIGPTFRSYAGRYRGKGPFSYGVSVDPLANIYASMRYALARYGSLSSAYNRPGGYDSGGWLQPGQLGFNGLSQPEAVLTPSQWRVMEKAANRGTEPREMTLSGPLYLEGGQLLGIVRGTVHEEMATVTTALRAGRGR